MRGVIFSSAKKIDHHTDISIGMQLVFFYVFTCSSIEKKRKLPQSHKKKKKFFFFGLGKKKKEKRTGEGSDFFNYDANVFKQ
jgi:hypothetical protein